MAGLNYNWSSYLTTEIDGDGTRTDFTPNFPALRREDIVVYVDGTATTS